MIKDQIIYQDNHLIVINKLPGQIVQGDKTGDTPVTEHVKAYIKEEFNKPGEVYLGLPHRIDRPTSGICVLARTSKALTRLNKLFQTKEAVQKTYLAVVDNLPEKTEGILEHYLLKNEKQNKSYVTKDTKKGKLAKLSYKVLASSDNYHLLEVNLLTGRHHQIRAQLSNMGSTIKGDVKYGARRANENRSIHLHAYKIAFTHPVKQEKIEMKAPFPKDALWAFFKNKIER